MKLLTFAHGAAYVCFICRIGVENERKARFVGGKGAYHNFLPYLYGLNNTL